MMSSKGLVDVYHSGTEERLRAPFLMVETGARNLLPHPANPGVRWIFWKTVPLNTIAVRPASAANKIEELGYFIQ